MLNRLNKKIKDLNIFGLEEVKVKGNQATPKNKFVEFKNTDGLTTITSRFEAQVKKYPDHIAVKTEQSQLTYVQLNQRANAVAHHIITLMGGEPEGVALLFDQDVDMVLGILSVLKARKYYIPLDPSYPKNRLVYMLKDSIPGVLLTHEKNFRFAKKLINELQGEKRIINLDTIDQSIQTHNPGLKIQPSDPAYILYTSGSTGLPKGVLQDHKNVLHFIRVYTNNLHVCHQDRLTLFSSYSFDAAVMDIYGAILNGATLCPYDILKEGNFIRMTDWPEQEEITIYHSIPTVYRYFIDLIETSAKQFPYNKDRFPKLRLLVLGGEAVNKKDVDLFQKYFSKDCLFINGLGPTESTVTLQYFIDKGMTDSRESIPVGFPVQETEILLLDQELREVPVYRPGEITYKSEYLALGYVNKIEITARVFTCDPITKKDRVFFTGDFGRRMEDGTIEFIGRQDSQVKVKGYRVELGEVETALDKLEGIKKSVVFDLQDSKGETHLACYYVQKEGNTLDENQLAIRVGEQLPQYMVPSVYLRLEKFPKTPTGKIDKRNLPKPDIRLLTQTEEYQAPATSMEKTLVDLWSGVLGFPGESISIHSNFFSLGGHSLKAIQIAAKLEKLKIRIPVNHIFMYPTIHKLAQQIEGKPPHKSEWVSDSTIAENQLKERLDIRTRLVEYQIDKRTDPVWVLYVQDSAIEKKEEILEVIQETWDPKLHPQYIKELSIAPVGGNTGKLLQVTEEEYTHLLGLKK
jgi:amino acid adenylation domain-containing protein